MPIWHHNYGISDLMRKIALNVLISLIVFVCTALKAVYYVMNRTTYFFIKYSVTIHSINNYSGTSGQFSLKTEMLALQHQGNRSWGVIESSYVSSCLLVLISATKRNFEDFNPYSRKLSQAIYFNLLQVFIYTATKILRILCMKNMIPMFETMFLVFI